MQAGDGKIGDAGQHVSKPGFWVDIIETGRGNEGQHDRSPVGATIWPRLPSSSDGSSFLRNGLSTRYLDERSAHERRLFGRKERD